MEVINYHMDDESICHYSSNEEEVELQPASDDEEEDEEQSKINSLGGRWYECVFCKRGFATAQALGGHMNIHRKDRAKKYDTPSISISSTSAMSGCYNDDHHRETYTGCRNYQPISHAGYPSPPPAPLLGATELGYPVYFPDTNNYGNNRGLYPYVGDDWSMLSLQLGSGMVHDYQPERSRVHKELDLELRLGPHP